MEDEEIIDIANVADTISKLNINEIIVRDVRPTGCSGHVIIPKRHLGKNAIIIIKNI